MSKTILSFDVSSTTIGWAVLLADEVLQTITYVNCGYIKPIKTGHIIERLADTRNIIQQLIKNHQPDCIAIEQIIQYMPGKSSAASIIMLAVFNRMIGLSSFDYLGKPPEMCNVMSIRHALKLNGILPSKQDMPQLIEQHLNIKFPYEYKRNGKIADSSYDKCDAVSVGLYQAMILTGKIVRKIKKPKKKKAKLK
jgi:Holliday junction resolvasome RuvABC endonuclease subunit